MTSAVVVRAVPAQCSTRLNRDRRPACPAMERHAPYDGCWPYELGASGNIQPAVDGVRKHDAIHRLCLENTLCAVTSDYDKSKSVALHENGEVPPRRRNVRVVGCRSCCAMLLFDCAFINNQITGEHGQERDASSPILIRSGWHVLCDTPHVRNSFLLYGNWVK